MLLSQQEVVEKRKELLAVDAANKQGSGADRVIADATAKVNSNQKSTDIPAKNTPASVLSPMASAEVDTNVAATQGSLTEVGEAQEQVGRETMANATIESALNVPISPQQQRAFNANEALRKEYRLAIIESLKPTINTIMTNGVSTFSGGKPALIAKLTSNPAGLGTETPKQVTTVDKIQTSLKK